MADFIEVKNAKVSFSTMKNKDTKKLFGRVFKVLVPVDSPELEKTIEQYKALNDLAKTTYGEKEGKKIKNAKSVDDVFAESIYNEGFVELAFNVSYFNDEVKTDEDGNPLTDENGKEITEKVEKLNPVYKKNPNFTYILDNNGNKVFEYDEGKYWAPLSGNTVNIKYSLVAKYSKKNNQPIIQLKAEEVQLLDTEFREKKSGSSLGFLTLSSEDEEIEQKVEKTAPKAKKTKPVEDDESATFTAEELASLDI